MTNRRKLKKVPNKLKYALIFCSAELIAVLAYKPLLGQAMAHRSSDAPGGEMLLVLLSGFIAVFAVDTVNKWTSLTEKSYKKRK